MFRTLKQMVLLIACLYVEDGGAIELQYGIDCPPNALAHAISGMAWKLLLDGLNVPRGAGGGVAVKIWPPVDGSTGSQPGFSLAILAVLESGAGAFDSRRVVLLTAEVIPFGIFQTLILEFSA